jgi:hypothetical protein
MSESKITTDSTKDKTFVFLNKKYKASLVASVILTHGISSDNKYKIEVYSQQYDFKYELYDKIEDALTMFKTIQNARGYSD